MKRSSRWLPCSSLESLNAQSNVTSEDQGSQPDDISVSVIEMHLLGTYDSNPMMLPGNKSLTGGITGRLKPSHQFAEIP